MAESLFRLTAPLRQRHENARLLQKQQDLDHRYNKLTQVDMKKLNEWLRETSTQPRALNATPL